nr:carboxypeptidase regulatory-like domain-containing protein [Acidobacteriota bacterium]
GARVEGRVTDPAGAPIDDVTVMLIGGDAMAAAVAMMTGGEGQATTAADGWFRIDDRREGETVDIVFRREGYGPQRLSGIAAPTLTPLAVTLQPASSISGSVADGEGRPIAGAEVTATRALGGPRGPGMFMMFNFVRPVDTDEQGKFTVDGLEPGKISLSVNAAGWQPHAREVEVPAGEDVTGVAVVLEPGAVVEGRVVGPDGAPVSGAQVGPVAGRQGGPGPRLRGAVQTDGDGRYRLEELLPGPASIEAEKQGFGRAVRDIELRTGANELDLQFEGGPPVSGVVLDPDGAPVPNADVRLNVAGQPWGGPTASTAADGTFRFERVAPGEYELDAAARGFAPSRGEVRVQVESEAVSGLEVRLARGGAIAGTVTGLAPEEYPDVDVLVVCRESWSMQRADVNFEGRFRVDGLAPCRYDVQGTVARTGRQARAEVELAAGAAEAAVELPFGLGLKLSGRVLLARQPVSGALVFASADNGRGTAPVRTDQEGKFNLEGLEADTYTVQVMEWSKGISHREVVVLDATRDITINIPTSRVAGRVLDAGDRQPIAGAVVTLTREGDDNPMRGMAGMGAATSAADGAFSIDHVAPGAWKLSARKDGYAVSGQLVSVMSGQDAGNVEVVLEPTEGLTLEVRLPGGRPASQVELALLDAAGQVMSTGTRQTGENGRVRLASAPAGSWELLIGAPGAAMLSTGVTAPGGPYAIELPPACRLQVRVADLVATRGSGAISLVGADGRQQRFLAWGGALNELRLVDGQINFEQLPPGQWTVYVRGDDGRTWRGTVATIPGAPASLSL